MAVCAACSRACCGKSPTKKSQSARRVWMFKNTEESEGTGAGAAN